MCWVGRPCLHAHAEGVQLTVEVLGWFGQNQTGIQARVPDPAEAQWHLLDQVVDWVALHAHRLVWVKVDALLRHGQDTETGASQPRDGHQVMGPHSVTCTERDGVREVGLILPISGINNKYTTGDKPWHNL